MKMNRLAIVLALSSVSGSGAGAPPACAQTQAGGLAPGGLSPVLVRPIFDGAAMRDLGLDEPFRSFARWTASADAMRLLGPRSPWLRLGRLQPALLSRALNPLAQAMKAPDQVRKVKESLARFSGPAGQPGLEEALPGLLQELDAARNACLKKVVGVVGHEHGYRISGKFLQEETPFNGPQDAMRQRIGALEADASAYEALSLYDDKIADYALEARRHARTLRSLFIHNWGEEQAALLSPPHDQSIFDIAPQAAADLALFSPSYLGVARDGGTTAMSGRAGETELAVRFDGAIGSPTRGDFFVKWPLQEERPMRREELEALSRGMGLSSNPAYRDMQGLAAKALAKMGLAPAPAPAPSSRLDQEVYDSIRFAQGLEPRQLVRDALEELHGKDLAAVLKSKGFVAENADYVLGKPDIFSSGQRVHIGKNGAVTLTTFAQDQIQLIVMDSDGKIRSNKIIPARYEWRLAPFEPHS